MTESDESHQEEQPTAPETPDNQALPPTWAPSPAAGSRPWRDPGEQPPAEPTPNQWPTPAAPAGPVWGGQSGWRQPPTPGAWDQGGAAWGGPGYPGAAGYPGGSSNGPGYPGSPGYQPRPEYGGGYPGGPVHPGEWPGAWAGGGAGGGWGPRPGQPYGWGGWAPTRARRTLPTTVTALLLAVAVLVGLGIGHGVWTSRSAASNPNGSGSGGSSSGGTNFGVPNFPSNGSGSANGGSNGSDGSSSLTGPESAVAADLVDINVSLSYQGDEAEGTGIVLTSDGLVLTNNHVISGATSVNAIDIGNGKTYTGTVLGYDRSQDVALIRLQNASGLQTAPIGDSNSVAVQEAVVGMGNAGGIGGAPSTATGQVTALNQSITAQDESTGSSEQLSGLIETNCDIQPGDSGGALVNSDGKVVGMDTAASVGFSFQTQGSQGYAIPINDAMSIANQIRNGQSGANIHLGTTAFMGVEVKGESGVKGAYVQTAIQGGPARAAGIGSGDVITAFGGSPVNSPDDLTKLISADHPGQKVQVTYTDPGGASHTTSLTLASGPPQ